VRFEPYYGNFLLAWAIYPENPAGSAYFILKARFPDFYSIPPT
jgi:hypothetical protein